MEELRGIRIRVDRSGRRKRSSSELAKDRDQCLRDQTATAVVQRIWYGITVGQPCTQRSNLQKDREMNANLSFALEWAGVDKSDQEKWEATKVSDDMLVLWALRGKLRWLEFMTSAMTFNGVMKKDEAEVFVAENLETLESIRLIYEELSEEIKMRKTKHLVYGLACQSTAYPVHELKLGSRGRNMMEIKEENNPMPIRLIGTKRKNPSDLPSGEELRSMEKARKMKAVKGLRDLLEKAGDASGLNGADMDIFDGPEGEALKEIVLSTGAPATLEQHLRSWLKFEEYVMDFFNTPSGPKEGLLKLYVYPPALSAILAYCNDLDKRKCGPSVIPAFRATASWMCKKLVMTTPDLKNQVLRAIETRVFEERGEEIKKANPFPVALIAALEIYLAQVLKKKPEQVGKIVAMFVILVMVYASLRFDDMLHVKPRTMVFEKGVLYGVCWQTKVERKKRGTKFAAPAVAISDAKWFDGAWKVFQRTGSQDRDFMLGNISDWDTMDDDPIKYPKFVSMLQTIIEEAWRRFKITTWGSPKVNPKDFAGHSARVTMIDLGSHNGESQVAQMVQANWSSPEMPLEYSRNTKSIAVNMIYGLVQKAKRGWVPGLKADQDVQVMDDEEGDVVQFFLKTNVKIKADGLRYHVLGLKDPTSTACGKIKAKDLEPAGHAPSKDLVCGKCHAARPDLFS